MIVIGLKSPGSTRGFRSASEDEVMLLLVLLCEPPEQPSNGLEFFYLVYLNRKKSQDTKERRPDIADMTLCVLCLNTSLAC